MLTSKETEELCKYFYIEQVPENRNYWLVRTNGGIYFDDFYSNGFISIGWDEFSSIEQMKDEKEEDVKQQIEKIYKDQKRPRLYL